MLWRPCSGHIARTGKAAAAGACSAHGLGPGALRGGMLLVRVPQQALCAQVRPKPGRAVLMDQDLLHRVSAPSPAAGGRPRYSLGPPFEAVWLHPWVVQPGC